MKKLIFLIYQLRNSLLFYIIFIKYNNIYNDVYKSNVIYTLNTLVKILVGEYILLEGIRIFFRRKFKKIQLIVYILFAIYFWRI